MKRRTDLINRIEQHGEASLMTWTGSDWRRWTNAQHGAVADFRGIMEDAWQRAAESEKETGR